MPLSAYPPADLTIDARHLACPMPLLKAKQGLHQLQVGQYLLVWATDRGSLRDFRSFAQLSEHELVHVHEGADEFGYLLRKGQKR